MSARESRVRPALMIGCLLALIMVATIYICADSIEDSASDYYNDAKTIQVLRLASASQRHVVVTMQNATDELQRQQQQLRACLVLGKDAIEVARIAASRYQDAVTRLEICEVLREREMADERP